MATAPEELLCFWIIKATGLVVHSISCGTRMDFIVCYLDYALICLSS